MSTSLEVQNLLNKLDDDHRRLFERLLHRFRKSRDKVEKLIEYIRVCCIEQMWQRAREILESFCIEDRLMIVSRDVCGRLRVQPLRNGDGWMEVDVIVAPR